MKFTDGLTDSIQKFTIIRQAYLSYQLRWAKNWAMTLSMLDFIQYFNHKSKQVKLLNLFSKVIWDDGNTCNETLYLKIIFNGFTLLHLHTFQFFGITINIQMFCKKTSIACPHRKLVLYFFLYIIQHACIISKSLLYKCIFLCNAQW